VEDCRAELHVKGRHLCLWKSEEVEIPTDWCAVIVVMAKSKGVPEEGDMKEKQNVRICSTKRETRSATSRPYTKADWQRAKVFTKLDVHSEFLQIPLSPSSEELTTFITPFGRYCYPSGSRQHLSTSRRR